MKTDVQLLQLLLDNMERLEEGLCLLIYDMRKGNEISVGEYGRLLEIIDNNPTRYYNSSLYYFPEGKKKPRIAYLKRLIKKYKK
jgi:hypothetical protein